MYYISKRFKLITTNDQVAAVSKLLLWKQNFKVFIIWLYRYIYLKAMFCTNMPETQLKFQHRILMAALFIERFINLHKKNL